MLSHASLYLDLIWITSLLQFNVKSNMTMRIFSLTIAVICFVGHSEGGLKELLTGTVSGVLNSFKGPQRHETTCQETCVEVENTNYPGFDIDNKQMKNGEGKDECATWCGTTEGCDFWSFRSSDNWCWIKNANTHIALNDYITSGNKACGMESAPICGGKEEPGANCECTDLIKQDHNDKDIGACLTQFAKKHWCYVSADSKCSDKKESSREKGLFYSASACTDYDGAPQKGGDEGTEVKNCGCTDLIRKDHKGKDIGACLTRYARKHWCYVPVDSECSDKKESSREKGLFWSSSACIDYDGAPSSG